MKRSLFILVLTLVSSIGYSNTSRVELINRGAGTEKQIVVKEKIVERVIERPSDVPKNHVEIIAGALASDLLQVKNKKDDEGKNSVTLPDENNLLYGFGYTRGSSATVGVSYMRNKPKTMEIYTFSLGARW